MNGESVNILRNVISDCQDSWYFLRAIWTVVITLQESRYPRLPYSSPDIRDYLSGVQISEITLQ